MLVRRGKPLTTQPERAHSDGSEDIMQIGVDAQRAVENRRVFVIDCDDINRTVLQFMLADENETHVFEDIKDACSKAAGFPPDLILMGTGLLAAHGASSVARVKQLLAPVRVLLVAEDADDPQITPGKAQGADGYFTKPLQLEAVRRKVDLALGRKVDIGIPVV
jgi:CheY-like chemotaxis protein